MTSPVTKAYKYTAADHLQDPRLARAAAMLKDPPDHVTATMLQACKHKHLAKCSVRMHGRLKPIQAITHHGCVSRKPYAVCLENLMQHGCVRRKPYAVCLENLMHHGCVSRKPWQLSSVDSERHGVQGQQWLR